MDHNRLREIISLVRTMLIAKQAFMSIEGLKQGTLTEDELNAHRAFAWDDQHNALKYMSEDGFLNIMEQLGLISRYEAKAPKSLSDQMLSSIGIKVTINN